MFLGVSPVVLGIFLFVISRKTIIFAPVFKTDLNSMSMKKLLIILLGSSLLLNSCNTYTGSGAYAGSSIGAILGSAIGGLSGGPRGSDVGTLIGMAGGAVVGAAIGSQADNEVQQQAERARRNRSCQQDDTYGYQRSHDSYSRQDGYTSQSSATTNDSGFDSSNSGDDRLYDFNGSDYTGNYSAQKPTSSMPSAKVEDLGSNLSYSPQLEIVNARFVDDNEDRMLNRNETCKIIFEIVNRSNDAVYDVVPTVIETTKNKHIFISPSIHVEKIGPGKGIRYTAMVKADNRLKDGSACFCVSVIHGDKAISKVHEFNIPTCAK